MASVPEAEPLLDEGGLAELARRIQIGDQAAIRDLHSTFATGIEFLLRRNLGKSNVTTEVASVLEAAILDIQRSSVVNLRRVVAQAIHRQFPPVTADTAPNIADASGERAARSLLAERTPLEQEILRRYYILRESPATIQRGLRVSSATVQKTIASARADFRRRTQHTESA
jgi:DNA-directed RNA polymerase specialized sigma24 family protein